MDKYYKLSFFLFFLLLSGQSFALVKPIGFTNTSTSIGIGTNALVKYSSGGKFYTKAVNIGLSSLGAVFKKRAFSPWGVILTTAIVAAGYIFDDDEEEITQVLNGSNVIGWCHTGTTFVFGKTMDECILFFYGQTILDANTLTVTYEFLIGGRHQYRFTVNNPAYIDGFWQTPDAVFVPQPNTEISTLTDTEIADLVIPAISENQIADILIDPETGLPDALIPEIPLVADELQTELDLLADADPLNDPVEQTESKTAEEEAVTKEEDFCKKNPNSVSCLDVGEDLTEEEIQTLDVPFSFTAVALTSSASCPSTKQINLSFGSIPLDTSMICDFATGINPVIIALCTFIGLYILNGGIRA